LVQRPTFARVGAERLRATLLRLLLAGQAAPMATAAAERPAARASLFRIALPYNRRILQEGWSSANRPGPDGTRESTSPIVVASPHAGTGVFVPKLQALFVHVVTEIEPADREGWIRAFVERRPLSLHVVDEPVEGPEAQAKVLLEELARF